MTSPRLRRATFLAGTAAAVVAPGTLTKLDPQVIEKMVLWQMGSTLEPTMITPVIEVMLKYGYLDRTVSPNDMIWRA